MKLDEGIKKELGMKVLPSYNLEHVTGYFHVPVDGKYNFSCTVDDYLIMKLAKYRNNANPENLETILKQ